MESVGDAGTGILITALLWLLVVVAALFVLGASVRVMRALAGQRADVRRTGGEPPVDAWHEAGRRLEDDSRRGGIER